MLRVLAFATFVANLLVCAAIAVLGPDVVSFIMPFRDALWQTQHVLYMGVIGQATALCMGLLGWLVYKVLVTNLHGIEVSGGGELRRRWWQCYLPCTLLLLVVSAGVHGCFVQQGAHHLLASKDVYYVMPVLMQGGITLAAMLAALLVAWAGICWRRKWGVVLVLSLMLLLLLACVVGAHMWIYIAYSTAI